MFRHYFSILIAFLIPFNASLLIRDGIYQPKVIGILHNVQESSLPSIYECVQDRSLISLSLRNDYSLPVLESFLSSYKHKLHKSECLVGASTVSTSEQITRLAQRNIDFLSTIFFDLSLINCAARHQIPIFCAVRSLNDCQRLVDYILSLKFPTEHNIIVKLYPISSLLTEEINKIMSLLQSSLISKGIAIPIIVSGGINLSTSIADLQKYFSSSVVNAAVGYDCSNSITQLPDVLKAMDEKLMMSRRSTVDTSYIQSLDRTRVYSR